MAHRLRERERGGLQAAVFAGMAVTVLGKSALVAGMRQIGVNEYFPPLPSVDLLLYRAPGMPTAAATALHECLAHYLRNDHALEAHAKRNDVTTAEPSSSGGEDGPALAPGPSRLERGSDAKDAALLEPRRDDLHADRQPLLIEAARNGRRRRPAR